MNAFWWAILTAVIWGCVPLLEKVGKVKQESASLGVIKADVEGAQVSLELKEISKGVTGITVSARKLFLPRPEIAEGVIYQIREELK